VIERPDGHVPEEAGNILGKAEIEDLARTAEKVRRAEKKSNRGDYSPSTGKPNSSAAKDRNGRHRMFVDSGGGMRPELPEPLEGVG